MHKKGIERARVLGARAREKRGGAAKLDDGVDRSDPNGLGCLCDQWLESLALRNYSQRTIESRAHSLHFVLLWLQERELFYPSEVTRPILESYQRALYRYRRPNGKALGFTTQRMRLTAVKQFFQWLCRQDLLLHNPASELEFPRNEHRLPGLALTHEEVRSVLVQPDVSDGLGVRDRAILEVFYSTGIRRMELVNLQVPHLDRTRKVLAVRQGKGKKDRVLPIGDSALKWTERYLEEVRPQLVGSVREQTLFLSAYGEAFCKDF